MIVLVLVDLDNLWWKAADTAEADCAERWGWTADSSRAPLPPALPLVHGREAVVVIAANRATLGELRDVDATLVRLAEAFARAVGATLARVEIAVVPNIPEAADTALERLAGCAPGDAPDRIGEVVLYSGDLGLAERIRGVLAVPRGTVVQPSPLPWEPWRFGNLARGRPADPTVAPLDAGPSLPSLPVAALLKLPVAASQWYAPTVASIRGVHRLTEPHAARTSEERWVDSPVNPPPRVPCLGGVPGTVILPDGQVVASGLPWGVIGEPGVVLRSDLGSGGHLHDSGVLSRLSRTGRFGWFGDSPRRLRVERGRGQLLVEIDRPAQTFLNDWWLRPKRVGKVWLARWGGLWTDFGRNLVRAIPNVFDGRVRWVAPAGDLAPGDLRVVPGLTISGHRLILADRSDRYRGSFARLQAPGVLEIVERFGLAGEPGDLLDLPVVVPTAILDAWSRP